MAITAQDIVDSCNAAGFDTPAKLGGFLTLAGRIIEMQRAQVAVEVAQANVAAANATAINAVNAANAELESARLAVAQAVAASV